MKYLIFNYNAISSYVQLSKLQSIEFEEGYRFYQHICGELSSEQFQNTLIEYISDGIIFFGVSENEADKRIFCIDLTSCNILSEKDNPSDLLTIIQKIMRTALKIWDKQPFSSSERVNKSLSIVFPFAIYDKRRVVIERADLPRLDKRGIKFPLLAYKYSDENPSAKEDEVNTNILKEAGEKYSNLRGTLICKLKSSLNLETSDDHSVLLNVMSDNLIERDDFIYWNYEEIYKNLTKSQKTVVDYRDMNSPLRIEGAAGTGKTLSMLLRAYRILCDYKKIGKPIRIIFFSHSSSTSNKNIESFSLFEGKNNTNFLNPSSLQSIRFTTLLDYCCEYSDINISSVTDRDALDAKNYELLIIDSILTSTETSRIKTFIPTLSTEMKDLFNGLISGDKKISVLCQLLHHEFGIQIKGRTDCSIDKYCELPSINNGLPCRTKRDKELVFLLFNAYQEYLRTYGNFDVNDVTLEALSRMNGPVWRRQRSSNGYDYIFVDEMHLFNVNEQSLFHYLTTSEKNKNVPICFALDYNQAIGDHGNKSNDYIEVSLENVQRMEYNTVFRNSPQIADFCASIAVSGTLMFQSDFCNPYVNTRSNFTNSEESKCDVPVLIMSNNDDEMISELGKQIDNIQKKLQCKPNDIVVISFESSIVGSDGIKKLHEITNKNFALITDKSQRKNSIILSSPYDINGLEFKAVILFGVDEGRVPQSVKTTDISQHFLKYSAFNLLYLTSSRAKYQLVLLGSDTRGISSCLDHSLNSGYIQRISD